MAVQIQLRRGVASLWTSVDPTLAEGEIGLETDTGKGKIGNGVQTWVELPYAWSSPNIAVGDFQYVTTPTASVLSPARYVNVTYNGNVTLTLPSAASYINQPINIKNLTGNNIVTVVTPDGALIEFDTSLTITGEDNSAMIASDGSNWYLY